MIGGHAAIVTPEDEADNGAADFGRKPARSATRQTEAEPEMAMTSDTAVSSGSNVTGAEFICEHADEVRAPRTNAPAATPVWKRQPARCRCSSTRSNRRKETQRPLTHHGLDATSQRLCSVKTGTKSRAWQNPRLPQRVPHIGRRRRLKRQSRGQNHKDRLLACPVKPAMEGLRLRECSIFRVPAAGSG